MTQPPKLDYANPESVRAPVPGWKFWPAFALTGFVQSVVLAILDEIMQHARGSHSDGGVFFVSVYVLVILVVPLIILRLTLRHRIGLRYAFLFAVVPLALYVGSMFIGILLGQ